MRLCEQRNEVGSVGMWTGPADASPRPPWPGCRSTCAACSRCAEQVATISSERLAEMAGVNAAKVRKDLSYLGSYGTRGVGYDVEYLLFQMSRELGLTHDWPVVIVGIGNLGAALANYGGFGDRGFPVAALVDADPAKVGHAASATSTIRHLDDLPELVGRARHRHRHHRHPGRRRPRTSPTAWSPPASRSVLNFAPAVISVPAERLAAQGRPRRRAADPELLPAATRRPSADGRARRADGASPRGRRRRRSRWRLMPVDAPLYPVNLVVAGRRCLVVGGGRGGGPEGRASCAACGAEVHVVAPEVGAETCAPSTGVIVRHAGPTSAGDVAGCRLVITATDDPGGQPPGVRSTARPPGSGSTAPTTRPTARSPCPPGCARGRCSSPSPPAATARPWPPGCGAGSTEESAPSTSP